MIRTCTFFKVNMYLYIQYIGTVTTYLVLCVFFFSFPLLEHLLQNGFCEVVGSLLENIPQREFESTTEVILKAAMKLKDSCFQQFRGHAVKFRSLHDNLLKLYHQDTEFDFYRDLSEVAKKLFLFLMEKDELWWIIKPIFGRCFSLYNFKNTRSEIQVNGL